MSFNSKQLAGLVTALMILAAAPATAQESPLSVEARTGAALAFGDVADGGSEAGPIFGVDAYYAIGHAASVYAGWGYHSFSDGLSANGPRVGLKALFPQPGGATPWVRAGATFNEAKDNDVASDRTLGLEVGAGFDFALTDRLFITPALRYHTFKADFGATEPTFTYLTIDMGLHLHF